MAVALVFLRMCSDAAFGVCYVENGDYGVGGAVCVVIGRGVRVQRCSVVAQQWTRA